MLQVLKSTMKNRFTNERKKIQEQYLSSLSNIPLKVNVFSHIRVVVHEWLRIQLWVWWMIRFELSVWSLLRRFRLFSFCQNANWVKKFTFHLFVIQFGVGCSNSCLSRWIFRSKLVIFLKNYYYRIAKSVYSVRFAYFSL